MKQTILIFAILALQCQPPAAPQPTDPAAMERVSAFLRGHSHFVDESDLSLVPEWMRQAAIAK